MGSDIETGKSIGNRLRENETFLNDVLNCIQDGISILDKDLNILFVNKTMEKWYAHQMPLMGKKCYEAYHGRDNECDICPSLQTLKDGKPAMEIAPYTTEEGVKGWLEVFTFPFKDSETGRIVGVIEYVRDISERKRVEEAHRRCSNIFENAEWGVATITGNGKTLSMINPAFATMYGYTMKELIGSPIVDLYAPESQGKLQKHMRLAHKNGHHTFEAKHVRKDGTVFPVHLDVTAVKDNDGDVLYCAINVQDITERKLAEEALRESEEKVRLLLNSTAEAIYGMDKEGNCTFCNHSFLRLMGYEKEEDLLGRNLHDLIHHTRVDGTECPIEKCRIYESLRKGKGVRVDNEVFWRSDGSSFYAEYRSYPIRRGRDVIGVVVTFTDITERRKAEAKLKRYAEDLKKSNRELKEFAAVASHDLQSPLISIISALKLLKRHFKGGLDPEVDGYITHIRERATNMLAAIRSLLKYSRLGVSARKFKPTDIETVLNQSISDLSSDITDSVAKVTHGTLPEVHGDAVLLTQLFQNLISNAIKYRGEESPLIHVSSKAEGDEWVFSVSDNGIGMAPEDIGKIFEIYHSLRTKAKYRGTGIGLATCKKIVKLHGGRIWVESALGEGSTFHLTLPITELDQPDKIDT